MNNSVALGDTTRGPYFTDGHPDTPWFVNRGVWWAQVYLLSLPESEILPQQQRELRQETHYSLSRQYPAKASLWQLVHLLNPGGNKRQSLVLIQRSDASWGSATNHSLPQALGLMAPHLFQELLSPSCSKSQVRPVCWHLICSKRIFIKDSCWNTCFSEHTEDTD